MYTGCTQRPTVDDDLNSRTMHRGRCWKVIQQSLAFSQFSEFCVGWGGSHGTAYKPFKKICHHNIPVNKTITLKYINILFWGVNYLRIFGFHSLGRGRSCKLTPPPPREKRGMTVHELLHYTPANTSGCYSRRTTAPRPPRQWRIEL